MTQWLLILLIFCGVSGMVFLALEQHARRAQFRRRLSQVLRPLEPDVSPLLRPAIQGKRPWTRRAARRQRFDTQIPDALRLISAALRAGHSPARAVQMLAEEMPPPASEEFALVLGEISLGVPAAAALARMSERVGSADWDLVAAAVTTQMQTGGNLAELLERIADTVRERVRVQAEIRTLTAESRLSAMILVALPPLLAGVLTLRDPHYFQPLLESGLGHKLIVGAVTGQALGTLVLRRMLLVDV